ncbi:MAG TPA: D-alanyl-D-alanine carboxypeptidase/D-alanyl-D-alanine-endopeptidase [Thermoanaerobaculia bacterium]|nr:D-alanyl-D-alanine carboxypeptidase/D-alanyl-D-alanine-endopeptidase [Thermoanaerobaculia bacterium]
MARSKLAVLTLIVLALVLGPASSEVETASTTALHNALQVQVAQALRVTAALGVHVVDLDTGESVYGYNQDELRVIASNTKLFTTAAILDALGPGYAFETRFMMNGPVKDGVLRGSLGVVGSGDPQISGRDYGGDSFAAFREWARALREKGVERVVGDVYLDHGLFDPQLVHPDWPRDQLTRWYEAPVEALSFSDNCILVRVWPARAGQAAQVELVPDVPVLQLRNTARTIGKGGQNVVIHRSGDELFVKGSIRSASGPVEAWVTVPDPVNYFGQGLVTALAEEGIRVEGRLRPVDRLPSLVWERVAVHRSDLLSAVRVTNKRSQNFYAESLAKHLGALRCGEGSWGDGVKAISEFATSLGIPRGSFEMADGSGMSRGNRFAPRHLTLLLRHMFFHEAASEFAQSLPYSGEDMGSWKRRMAEPPYRGNVFAKTGTLEGVSALSGYAKAVSGKAYAFSILLNRVGGDARGAQDGIIRALIDNG